MPGSLSVYGCAAKAGFIGFEAGQWYGFFAPRETPEDRVRRISFEIAQSSRSAGVMQLLERQGVEAFGAGPEEAAAYFRQKSAKWKKVIEAIGAGRS